MFDTPVRFVIGWIGTFWELFKSFSGTIINSTFGAFTGRTWSENEAGMGMAAIVVLIIAIIIAFRKLFKH